jgi:hypothetical protein
VVLIEFHGRNAIDARTNERAVDERDNTHKINSKNGEQEINFPLLWSIKLHMGVTACRALQPNYRILNFRQMYLGQYLPTRQRSEPWVL